MNWKQVADNWTLERPRLQRRWDKLTSGDLEIINADRDRLIERLCARYGLAPEEANRRIGEWEEESASRLRAHEAIQRADEDSFPASDPPSWTPQSSVRKDRPDTSDNVTAAPPRKREK